MLFVRRSTLDTQRLRFPLCDWKEEISPESGRLRGGLVFFKSHTWFGLRPLSRDYLTRVNMPSASLTLTRLRRSGMFLSRAIAVWERDLCSGVRLR